MAQEQQGRGEGGAIKYGDVFEMSGEMADQPISPRDAAAMRSAENRAFGKTIKGGPASIMLQAAAKNVQAGLVGPDDTFTSDKGPVKENPWHESQLSHEQMESAISVEGATGVTIGEALEAVAEAVGNKPVDRSDASATGSSTGLGAHAQAAATSNARIMFDEEKTKLSHILEGATHVLTDDKPATKRDAERVKAAELQGPAMIGPETFRRRQSTTHGGVAEAVEAAARINEPADK